MLLPGLLYYRAYWTTTSQRLLASLHTLFRQMPLSGTAHAKLAAAGPTLGPSSVLFVSRLSPFHEPQVTFVTGCLSQPSGSECESTFDPAFQHS